MGKPEDYGIEVRRITDDGSFVYEGRVKELPDVRTYGDSQAEAYGAALEVIAITQEAFAEKSKPFPSVQPTEDEFSGRITLRMSKSLHKKIHHIAKHEEVSLNHWIVEQIASNADKDRKLYTSAMWEQASNITRICSMGEVTKVLISAFKGEINFSGNRSISSADTSQYYLEQVN